MRLGAPGGGDPEENYTQVSSHFDGTGIVTRVVGCSRNHSGLCLLSFGDNFRFMG